MVNGMVSSVTQFLKYFGRRGKAPKLIGWEFSEDEFVKDKIFNYITVVYYREYKDYVAKAEASLKEGFYSFKISLNRPRFPVENFSKGTYVKFQDFYRKFQEALYTVMSYLTSLDKQPETKDSSVSFSYLYNMFFEIFGENGSFVPNSNWDKDDIVEINDPPELFVFFYCGKIQKNHAIIMGSTNYKFYDSVLQINSKSTILREEIKENLENIFDLREAIINYMRIAELDLISRGG
jgi:hypothetical protein